MSHDSHICRTVGTLVKTKEITTVKEILTILLLRLLLSSCFDWEDISNTRDRVSSAIQTPRISSKILRFASYFQLSSRCLDYYPDETLSLVFDILLLKSLIIHQNKQRNHNREGGLETWRYRYLETAQCFIGYPKTLRISTKMYTPLHYVFSAIFSVFGYLDETLSLVLEYKTKNLAPFDFKQPLTQYSFYLGFEEFPFKGNKLIYSLVLLM